MNAPKIIFFDIDRTLRREETGYLPVSALQAIHQLRQKGIHTAIATGRSPVMLPADVKALFASGTMDILVSLNGQFNLQYLNPQKTHVISGHPLPQSAISKTIALFKERKWQYGFMTPKDVAISAETPLIKQILADSKGYIIDAAHYRNRTIYQMMLFITPAQDMALQAQGFFSKDLQNICWHPHCSNLITRNGAKARGIKDVCAALNIDLKDTMAFGDGYNDVEMFKTVATGVAMGDAREPLKAIASYITGTLEEDGIANALKQLKLID